MLKIVQRRLPVRLRPEEAYQVQQNLQTRFNSLLAGVRLEYLRRLGLDSEPRLAFGPPEGGHVLAGEIFMPEPGTIYYIKYLRDQDTLEAGGISNHRDRDFDPFFADVRDALLEVVSGAGNWESPPEITGADVEEARSVSLDVSEKELEAAHEFLTVSSKGLLEQLAQSESTLLKKLQLPRGDAEGLLAHLEDLELIRKDYAVLSKETGQQILRVASKASIEESKFFAGEHVDEVISCTPFCRSLLENDQWLLILTLGTLRAMGLGQGGETVQVCQQAHSPIQLFLGLNQQRFLLVLVNNKLSLDDSYLISAQISACRLTDVVVISTHKISTLMKHHLSGANPQVSFDFIDSMDSLEDRLQQVFVGKQRGYIRDLLDPLSELTPVRIHELVIRKMAPLAAEQAEEESSFTPVAPSVEVQAIDALPDFAPPPAYHPPAPARELPPPHVVESLPSLDLHAPLDLPSPEVAVPEPYEFASPVSDLPGHSEGFEFPLGEMMPPLPVDDFHSDLQPGPRMAPGGFPAPAGGRGPSGQPQRPILRPAPAGPRPGGSGELPLG